MSRARRRRSAWTGTLGLALLGGAAFGLYVQRAPATGLSVSEMAFSSRLDALADPAESHEVLERAGTQALRRAVVHSPHVHLLGGRSGRASSWRLLGVAQPDPAAPGALQLGLKASPLDANAAPLVAFVALAGPSRASLDGAAQRGVRLLAAMRAVRDAGPKAWHRLLAEDAMDAAEGAERTIAGLKTALGAPVGEGPGTAEEGGADGGTAAEPAQARPAAPPAASARDALTGWAQLQAVALEGLVSARAANASASLLPLVERGLRADATAYAQQLGLRAVGGLVALQDANAVLPLIEISQRREPALVLQLVYAIAALGGRHAEGYLVTLGSGHPHPEVRGAARRAVAEMVERARRDGASQLKADPA